MKVRVIEESAFGLDSQQMAAVTAPHDRPVLVLAGAGSGKTRTLTSRVAWLIEQGVMPERMIVCTFTRKAADELKDRLKPMIGDEKAGRLMCNTIHGICLAILREEGKARDVMSGYEKKKLIEQGLHAANWDIGWKYPEYWIARQKIGNLDGIGVEDWYRLQLMRVCDSWQANDLAMKLARVYHGYVRDAAYEQRMDFEDMIRWVWDLLKKEEMLRKWQARVEYVLTDENQDTSRVSLQVLELLAAPENRLFVVGDNCQVLFKWSGADPEENLFGFAQRHSANVYRIETNYRATEKLVLLGNKLIDCMDVPEKFQKVLRPRSDAPAGEDVEIYEAEDVCDEASWVQMKIRELMDRGYSPKDFFVLYRLNALSRAVEDALIRAKVPYVIQGSVGFYDRAVVKDVLAYMKMAESKDDNEAFRRIANIASGWHSKPYRGFGSQFFAECSARHRTLWYGMQLIKSYQKPFKRSGIEDFEMFVDWLEKDSKHVPSETVRMIRQFCYDEWLKRREGVPENRDIEETGYFDDLDELVEAARGFSTNAEMLAYVDSIREARLKQSREENPDVVTLSTPFRAKGLERPIVFGIGFSDGILPHWRTLNAVVDSMPTSEPGTIQDERCVAFVIVSRAREKLYLSWVKLFREREMSRSRFLDEMFGEDNEV